MVRPSSDAAAPRDASNWLLEPVAAVDPPQAASAAQERGVSVRLPGRDPTTRQGVCDYLSRQHLALESTGSQRPAKGGQCGAAEPDQTVTSRELSATPQPVPRQQRYRYHHPARFLLSPSGYAGQRTVGDHPPGCAGTGQCPCLIAKHPTPRSGIMGGAHGAPSPGFVWSLPSKGISSLSLLSFLRSAVLYPPAPNTPLRRLPGTVSFVEG